MKVCFKNFVNLTDEEIKLVHTERNKSVIREKMYNQNEIPFESHMECDCQEALRILEGSKWMNKV